MFDLEFFLFEFESFGGLGFADSVIEVLIDEGATGFAESAGEFSRTEFKKKDENDQVGEAEHEDSADLAKNGSEELIVQEVADVAPGHFACGRRGAFETAGSREKRVGKGGAEHGGSELKQACAGDEEDSKKNEFLGVADFFRKEEEESACDKDNREKIRTEAKEKKKDSPEIGTRGSDEVGFGVLRGLGVEGEVARIEGKECEKKEDAGAEDRESYDFLAKAGSGAGRFGFGHKREGV